MLVYFAAPQRAFRQAVYRLAGEVKKPGIHSVERRTILPEGIEPAAGVWLRNYGGGAGGVGGQDGGYGILRSGIMAGGCGLQAGLAGIILQPSG